MEQFRCSYCNKRLFDYDFKRKSVVKCPNDKRLLDYDFKEKVVVKCPRCGKVNKLERF